MRESSLLFALPDLDESELSEIREALDSGWITIGPKVRRFEAEFAAYVGARHAIAAEHGLAVIGVYRPPGIGHSFRSGKGYRDLFSASRQHFPPSMIIHD